MKKFCSIIVAYNEQKLIAGCLEGLKDIHNIVSISTPWQGEHLSFDRTADIAKQMGAQVVLQNFRTEGEQRTAMSKLAKELGYDYILVIDADEYYRKEDILQAMEFISLYCDRFDRFDIATEYNLWKDANWEVLPRIANARLFCVPAGSVFPGNRNINVKKLSMQSNIELFHFSYTGDDDKILSKLTHFSHAHEVKKGWFEKVWQKWTPDMENIHPCAPHVFKKAIPFDCPEDIKQRYNLKI